MAGKAGVINEQPNVYAQLDASGGMQNATSHLLRKRNEIYEIKNGECHSVIGSVTRRPGYEQVGQIVQQGNAATYGGVYLYGQNNKIINGTNNASNSATVLSYMDSTGIWNPIYTNTFPNCYFEAVNYLDEFYVCGTDLASTNYNPLININSTLTSTGNNVIGAPTCRFVGSYAGQLYAFNCQVNGVTYKNRVYLSSAPLGVVTHIQGTQSGQLVGLNVDLVHYLKVGMTIDVFKAGTSQLLATLPITYVDKVNNVIGFQQQNISVNNLDEIWIHGRYGLLTTLWNTDYPTPETADWLEIPAGEDESNAITGWTVNSNRLFFWSKNSMWKWDGQNLIRISPVIGCVAHRTIQNVAAWTIWLHSTGVWGYNDNTGQLKLLSRAINPTLLRINPSSYPYCTAVLVNRKYKLSIGQIQNSTVQTSVQSNTVETTSTSTSSTSTSSTSSSTSSTSTSSTSTSTIITTTSTSSTSTSISSTSSSTSVSTSTSTTISFTTSTSQSTSTSLTTSTSLSSTSSTSSSSSTSTSSTTTVPTGKDIRRMVYDFDLNTWWQESHYRDFRAQFIHEMNGFRKPYFFDENGNFFRDETGLTDAGQSIPFEVHMGRVNLGTETSKTMLSTQIDSENARGGILQYSVNGGDFLTLGQAKDVIELLPFPQNSGAVIARDIDYKFVHNDYGSAPIFNGLTSYFIITEQLPNELGQRL